MSKQFIILITVISIFSLAGCSSSKEDTPTSAPKENVAEPNTVLEKPAVEEPKEEEPKEEPKNKQPETQPNTSSETDPVANAEVVIQTTPLFEDVYVKQCDSVGSLMFQGAKHFAETLSYNIEITDLSEDSLSTIKFSDENNNSVYLMFYADTDPEIETLSVIEYTSGNTGKSISATDDLHLVSSYKNIHNAGSPSQKVSSIEEQKEFLFSAE